MRRPPHIVRLQVLRILAKEIDKVTEQLGELQTVRRESPVSACFVSSNLEKFCIFFFNYLVDLTAHDDCDRSGTAASILALSTGR